MKSKFSGTVSQRCMEKDLLMVSVQQLKVRAEDAEITDADFAKFLDSLEVSVVWLSENKKVQRNVDIGLKIIIAT